MPGTTRIRLDRVLVERHLTATRARARDAVRRGCVTVEGLVVTKPAALVEPSARIVIDDAAGRYVSRAALKLIAGLDRFGYSADGRVALDLGASTGGFTQVLLQRGADHVFAVDVGHDQFDPSIAADAKVTVMEGINARDLGPESFDCPITAITCDVSFISLKLALPPALALAAPGAWGLFLIKPQFEAGRDALGKDGVIRDPAVVDRVVDDIVDWIDGRDGWAVDGTVPSPIEGGTGNREVLIGARRD